jgi:acetate kinase
MPAQGSLNRARAGLLLTVNTGSSSVKLDLFRQQPKSQPQHLATANLSIDHRDLHNQDVHNQDVHNQPDSDLSGAPQVVINALHKFLSSHGFNLHDVGAVAHRLVHGGSLLRCPTLLTAALNAKLGALTDLAPLHNPLALLWLRGCRLLLGEGCAQLLVPETGFFIHLPRVARQYALPRDLSESLGLHRYGFHGLAHEFMWQAWCAAGPKTSASRLLSLQLGAGCSITATLDGKPQDTSMGFTPLEGLVMATRCGDLDAGLVLWLQRQAGMSVAAVDRLLNSESGLYGISGGAVGGDAAMVALLARQDEAAKDAVALYVYRLRKYLGAYMAVLGGVDGVMFGGGVGEHAPQIRAAVLQGFEWAGIELDQQCNAALLSGNGLISTAASAVKVLVCQVDEAQLLVRRLSAWLDSASGFLSTPD